LSYLCAIEVEVLQELLEDAVVLLLRGDTLSGVVLLLLLLLVSRDLVGVSIVPASILELPVTVTDPELV
jgi:hypothetical protein